MGMGMAVTAVPEGLSPCFTIRRDRPTPLTRRRRWTWGVFPPRWVRCPSRASPTCASDESDSDGHHGLGVYGAEAEGFRRQGRDVVQLFQGVQGAARRIVPSDQGRRKFQDRQHRAGPGAGFGAGFDGGSPPSDQYGHLRAFTLKRHDHQRGVPRPTLSLGTAYTWRKWLTLAGDLRVRSNLTEFFPGLEASFFQGLLRGRVGGISLGRLGPCRARHGAGLFARGHRLRDIGPLGGDFPASRGVSGLVHLSLRRAALQRELLSATPRPKPSPSTPGSRSLREKKKNLDREAQTSDSNRTAIQGEYASWKTGSGSFRRNTAPFKTRRTRPNTN